MFSFADLCLDWCDQLRFCLVSFCCVCCVLLALVDLVEWWLIVLSFYFWFLLLFDYYSSLFSSLFCLFG